MLYEVITVAFSLGLASLSYLVLTGNLSLLVAFPQRMIAVGEFEVIKDRWRDMPVFFYVEKKDIEKAKELSYNFV